MRVLALFISLLTATCFADSGASLYGSGHGVAAVGGSCSSTIDQSSADSSFAINSGYTLGQSWTTSASAEELCSIVVNVAAESMEASESGTATLRYYTALDMSVSYSGEKAVVINDGETGPITFDFTDTYPSLPTSTTLYFKVTWSLNSTDEIFLARYAADGNSYTGGAYYADSDGGFDGGSSSARDLQFTINTR